MLDCFESLTERLVLIQQLLFFFLVLLFDGIQLIFRGPELRLGVTQGNIGLLCAVGLELQLLVPFL